MSNHPSALATGLAWLRSLVYYAVFIPATLLYSLLCLLIGPWLPYPQRFRFVTAINYFYIGWLRVCCGVKVRVSGREHLDNIGPYVAVCNHQSEWETIYLQLVVRPQCVVLKQSLLKVPFFGWALALLKPIALDRSQRRRALKQLLEQGRERLTQGISVLIFPQGTRVPAGQRGKFNKGGAMLAVSAGVPVVPLAHNAGRFWPGKAFIKYPGTIELRIGAPVDTLGCSVDEVHQAAIGWLDTQLDEIDPLIPDAQAGQAPVGTPRN